MKRAVGYVRESTEEQGKQWAPDVQRKAIEGYVRDQEWELVDVYQDFVSGRAAEKRPDFQRLLRDAAERKFEVVVVYHSSRFARNVYEARQYKEYLRKRLDIEIISVTQRFGEQDDPSSFLMEGLNEVLDEHYSRNLGFLISAGLKEKASQGYLLGNLPFGYARPQGDTRRAVPDKREAEVVRKVFERYASGSYSYAEIADWLNSQGHRGRRGHPFSKWTVEEIVRNVAYAGCVGPYRADLSDSSVVRGNHEPIVTRELYERAQAARHSRAATKHGTRRSRHRYLLSGTAVCARCGARLYGSRGGNGNRYARYLCQTRSRAHKCDQPQVLARIVETHLAEFVGDLQLTDEHIGTVMEALRVRVGEEGKKKDSSAELRRRVARLKDLYELGDLERGEYLRRKTKVEGLLAEAAPMPNLDLDRCMTWLRDFRDLWERETDEREKQGFVKLAFERIVVDDKQITAVKPRPDVLPLFVARSDVHPVGSPEGAPSRGDQTQASDGHPGEPGAHSRGDWI